MAGKLVRESKFSSLLRGSLSREFDAFRMETRIEDGLCDILAVRKSDGLPCFLELKQVDHFNKSGEILIDIDPLQAIFLYERVRNNPHVGAALMLRVGESTIYTFPAMNNPKWCFWIRKKMKPDLVELPFCFRHSVSQLPQALELAYSGRFTPAALTLAA